MGPVFAGGPLLAILLWLAAMVGVCLLFFGLRGRRVHRFPTCSKCSFDLSGTLAKQPASAPQARSAPSNSPGSNCAPTGEALDDASPATPMRCPECGVNLARRGAVSLGLVQRRRGMIIVGALVLLASLAGQGVWWHSRNAARIPTLKPTWLLTLQAQGTQDSVAARNVAELLRRVDQKNLSDEQTRRLVAIALRIQADRGVNWLSDWGDIVSIARSRGLVSDEQWIAFARAGLETRLVTRNRIHPGMTSLQVQFSGPRLGSGTGARVLLSPRTDSLALAGGTITGGISIGSRIGVARGGAATVSAPVTITREPGTTRVEAVLRLDLIETRDSETDASQIVGSWSIPLARELNVLKTGEPLVEAVANPALREAFLASLSIERLTFEPEIVPMGDGDPLRGTLHYTVYAQKPPMEFAGAIIVRWIDTSGQSREAVIGGVAFQPLVTHMGSGGGSSVEAFNAERVQVILRPDPAVAAQAVGFDRCWTGEDLVFDDVPVDRRPPPEPASTEEANEGG
ncbi:MAG: hypothetical protein SFZ23_07770 [Planctomycetota bacterium]|nr:hypothetical protein [Planctomycetota bacterium]